MKIYSHFLRETLLKIYLYLIPLLISIYVRAQTITPAGSTWAVSVPAITEAGDNYTGTYQSASNVIILSGNLPGSFLNLLSSGAARVSTHYNATTWNSNLHLYAKRAGGSTTINGICVLCTATINGGTTYTEIPLATAASFFTINFTGVLGLGNSVNFSAISVQLQIAGVSVTVPAASYSAQIVFTIGAN
ncbi:hypothetical protein LF887_21745 [Chryseobacterium sp. MEBOG06]|uniref:hypothetical protein n=1 Tax=unclassified Chryseobacterium TaxID=2593645 RepID=UPI001F39619C|nr:MULTISPECIES: hypothetical protein [unclassified Chryseobacterium]UKB83601.1 hypothetical protein LF887_21745 [Chryseobacterium sp. MEBOG06]